jgi:hypothetical protein
VEIGQGDRRADRVEDLEDGTLVVAREDAHGRMACRGIATYLLVSLSLKRAPRSTPSSA